MFKKSFLGAGAALALMTSSSALAQVSDAGEFGGPAEPHIMAAKSDWGGVRAAHQGDNDIRGIPLSEYRRLNTRMVDGVPTYTDPGDKGFYAILAENKATCEQTGDWIRESIEIQTQARALGLETVAVRDDLLELGNDLRNAAFIRTGGNVLGTAALCALSGGWYCGAAVLFGIGNEAQGQAHAKQARINRKQSLNSADLTILNTRAMILHTQMNIGWAKQVRWYCLAHHTDATIGMVATTSTTQTRGTPKPW